MTRVIYLHGFASSPHSRKAEFFRERLAAEGVAAEIPALDEGDFKHLTLTRQLALLERIAAGQPVFLIGSSMGGYLAALYSARHENVRGMILLAPAFNFHRRWIERLGPEEMAAWKARGELDVYHYGEGRNRFIAIDLMNDAQHYEPFPLVRQPCVIFHGTEDDVVPVQYSEAFVHRHPDVRLIKLSSGHELTDVLGDIWIASRSVLLEALSR